MLPAIDSSRAKRSDIRNCA